MQMFDQVKNSSTLPQNKHFNQKLLVAIAFISGSMLAYLMLSSGHSEKQQIMINPASSFVSMETYDLHNIAKSILSFKSTSEMNFNFKRNRIHWKEDDADNSTSSYVFIEKKDLLRVVISFVFTVIDANKDQLINKTEWETFFTKIDSQFQSNYTAQYNDINGGQPFNLQTLLASVNKIFGFVSLFVNNLTRNGQLQLAKMIINDKDSYKNFQNMLFKITDLDRDNFITIKEIISLFVTLGLPAKKAETRAVKFLELFQRMDSQRIQRKEFDNFFVSLRKPLQECLITEKAFLRVHQLEMEMLQQQKQIDSFAVLKRAYEDGEQTEEIPPPPQSQKDLKKL